MTTLTKALLGVIALLGLAVVVQTRRVSAHRNDAVEAAVAPAKEAAAQAKAKVETVTVALAARIDTVTRVITRTKVDSFEVAPKTPADTAHAVQQLPTLVAEHAELQRSCSLLVSDCERYRAAAEQRFRADSTVIAKLEDQVRARPLPRRFSLGATAGYGVTLHQGQIITGPSATLGVHWRIF